MIPSFNFNEFLTEFSSLSIFIPLIVGFSRIRTLFLEQRILLGYIILAAITEFISSNLASRRINNLALLHIFTAIEFAFLVAYFHYIFKKVGFEFFSKTIITFFLTFVLININFFESLDSFNANSRSLEGLILIVLSALWLFKFSTNSKSLLIGETAAFWGCSAILFYFSGTLFIFASSKFLIENWADFYPSIWTIHSFCNIIFSLLLGKALWNKIKA